MELRSDSRPTLEVYVMLVFALGASAFTAAFFLEAITEPLALCIILAVSTATEAMSVRLHHQGRVSVSSAGVITAALSIGVPGAVLTAAAIAITGWLCYARREPKKLLFNFGQTTVAAFLAGAVTVGPIGWLTASNDWFNIAAGVLAGLVMFQIGALAVSGVLAITTDRAWREVYRSDFLWLTPHYAALGAVGGGLAAAFHQFGLLGLATLSAPLLISRYSIKQVVDQTRDHVLNLEKYNQQLQGAYTEIRTMSDAVQQAYTGTLETLVTALDVRDQETKGHSVRVATHSLEIAKLLGIADDEELGMIYRGALMHDVGKIGVPDGILLKPGKLTEEEWVFMRKHSAMGYKILAQVPYLRPTAMIVLAHHERWDGDGYPRKLKGENIPLGSRIFAVCDTYDAIISDRPYRAGQTPEAAFAEILRCSGSQFDPGVLEAFEALFPGWALEDPKKAARPIYLPSWRKHDAEPTRRAG